jgi:hypothetical protein
MTSSAGLRRARRATSQTHISLYGETTPSDVDQSGAFSRYHTDKAAERLLTGIRGNYCGTMHGTINN